MTLAFKKTRKRHIYVYNTKGMTCMSYKDRLRENQDKVTKLSLSVYFTSLSLPK